MLFGTALVVALLGTVAVASYVSGANDRALAGQRTVEVLVAKDTIAAGTSAAQASGAGLVTTMRVPQAAVPPGALSKLTDVGKRVAASDIVAGEMLLDAKFVIQQAVGALAIPGDKLAVSVELTDPARVAGFVLPGSEVAVFDTYDQARGSSTAQSATQVLLSRVTVIAVGTTTQRKPTKEEQAGQPANDKPVGTTVLTLAVSQQEAAKLVHGAQTGKLYFGLLSRASKTGGGTAVTNASLASAR